MKHSSACFAAIFVLALGTAEIAGLGGSALAQGQAASGTVSWHGTFPGDTVDPTPEGIARFRDATAKATGQGDCPRGKVTVVVPKGDPIFQEALGAARRDLLLRILGDQARYFFFEVDTNGAAEAIKVDYDVARDREPPRLAVTWTPAKGSRVKPGQRIKADAIARDDANLWQTGVAEIEFLVRPEERPFGFHQWPQQPVRCESTPSPRRADAVYTVPDNPPPVVRLSVHVKDFAGHEIYELAEFPTTDWVGTLIWELEHNVTPTATSSGNRSKRSGRADIGLKQKPDGTVEGTLRGSQTSDNWWGYAGNTQFCRWRSARPNEVRAKLDGAYEQTRGHPLFQASDVAATLREELVESRKCVSPTQQSDVSAELIGILPMLAHRLERRENGRYVAYYEFPGPELRGKYTLTLRRTEN